MAQTVFMRNEKKYLLTMPQYAQIKDCLSDRMQPDEYGVYSIANIYYDTDNFDLIRASIEKPVYKEKLRLRSYGGGNDLIFLELKKKYKGIVYKRRLMMRYGEAVKFIREGSLPGTKAQIMKEIEYFLRLYKVSEKVFISYDRQAFTGLEQSDLRLTFDSNLRFRTTELSLDKGNWGKSLSEEGKVLMEIKIPGAFPVWLSYVLSELRIFPISFSKYGLCYCEHLAVGPDRKEREISA